jgi:hypothetical protein
VLLPLPLPLLLLLLLYMQPHSTPISHLLRAHPIRSAV